ncbi:hypothetical protein DPMN_057215, partial [Dreissena polymorpha]
MATKIGFLMLLVLSGSCQGFYIPGVAPNDFKKDDLVDVKGVKLTSVKTQLPMEYYRVPFCEPEGGAEFKPENLGEVLRGDRIVTTAYQIRTLVDKTCTLLCGNKPAKKLTQKESRILVDLIKNDYYVNLLVDNLPAATKFMMLDSNTEQYEHGYKLGFEKDGKYYLNNHLAIVLKYHTVEEGGNTYRVVGFEVKPESRAIKDYELKDEQCARKTDLVKGNPEPMMIEAKEDQEVLFTYEVSWHESPMKWASRWDLYLTMSDVQIHWFSIVNSVVVVFFLS